MSAALRRLVLWDVDGTLVRCGPATREVFSTVFAEVIGRSLGEHNVKFSGKTDPQIARELLEFAQIPSHDVERHLPQITAALERGIAGLHERFRADGCVLPGVEKVLARLRDDPSVVQTLLTGNLAPNAAVKITAFELDDLLDLEVGAYGSDHADRRELVPIAIERVAEKYGQRFRPEDTWVIGDSANDLACAVAGGARCMLVATGGYSVDELHALGADIVLENLEDTDAVVDLLTG